MYVGRIVAIAKSHSDRLVAMYRISSRSFPNRDIRLNVDGASVVPRSGFESDASRNPFIVYNCLRIVKEYAVVGNGNHVDPIAGMLDAGTPSKGWAMRPTTITPLESWQSLSQGRSSRSLTSRRFVITPS